MYLDARLLRLVNHQSGLSLSPICILHDAIDYLHEVVCLGSNTCIIMTSICFFFDNSEAIRHDLIESDTRAEQGRIQSASEAIRHLGFS